MVADSTPPPWSYDVPDYLTMGVSGKEVHGFEKNPYKSPAFLDKMAKCAVSNFVKQTSDPGAYSPGGPKRGMGDVTSHNKNSSQGLGAFGSRQERGEQFAMAARNAPPEGEASTPPREMKPASGAASDRSKPRAGAAERRRPSSPRSDMRSASFRSASPCRGGHVRPTITPGVGHYDYTDDPDKIGAKTMMRPTQSFSNAGSSVFAAVTAAKARSGSPSRPLHDLRSHLDPLGQVKEMVDVAPGSHNPRIDSIAERAQRKLNARSPGFGSSSARSTSINARHPFLG